MDLEAICDMNNYKACKPDMAEKCLTSMSNHSWYLYPNLIPLSLLDAGVPEDEKKEIAEKILGTASADNPLERRYDKIKLYSIIEADKKPSLADVVDVRSRLIFDILKFDKVKMEWMLLPPNMWHLLTPFKEFSSFTRTLPVVNDAAERNVKLVQEFVTASHDENLKQALLLAVDVKRKGGRPKENQTKRKKN